MLRAGPFSDERVIRTINRRFVPLYFDLSPAGAAADGLARQLVVKVKPALGGPAVETPPLLVVTPGGALLSETSNYASEDELLSALRAVLESHPEWNEPGEEERRLATSGTPIERANLLFDLGDEAAARTLLKESSDADAAVLLARFCRLARDWEGVEQALARVKGAVPAGVMRDAQLERAWLAYARRDAAAAIAEIGKWTKESPRYSEARYVVGLAQLRRDSRRGKLEALATWKALIDCCSQDPWVYRADWAYTQVASGSDGHGDFSTGGERISPLGRIGYMGRRNPDLDLR